MFSAELSCRDCGWRTVVGEREALGRLRALGALRRASDPPEELLQEMLRLHASRLSCDACRGTSVEVSFEIDDDAGSHRGDWGEPTLCRDCRQPIPAERLEFAPDADRCVACQRAADAGAPLAAQIEYCPKCGAVLELRPQTAGVTRYRLYCTGSPPCRL